MASQSSTSRAKWLEGMRDRLGTFGEVDLGGAEAQLELAAVERRASIEELGAEDLGVPVPCALAITDLER